MVNGPAGISTSDGRPAEVGEGGAGARSGGPDRRSWWVASMVSACCCSCWITMPNAKPELVSRLTFNGARSSTSSTFSRTWPT